MSGDAPAFLALGLPTGLLIGCVGVGVGVRGVVVVPALTYVIGVPIRTAIAAAMFGYVFAGLVGTVAYARR